eukprot:GFUD01092617.1.p1 GENE.GFUD01092617.1~~GFUD01092617.1.p1  ORF type:complete len:429 (-),score=79.17 GFUD01092617.1:100-1344(-)
MSTQCWVFLVTTLIAILTTRTMGTSGTRCVAGEFCTDKNSCGEYRKWKNLTKEEKNCKVECPKWKKKICNRKPDKLCCKMEKIRTTTATTNITQPSLKICETDNQIYPKSFLPKKDQCGLSCSGPSQVVFGTNAVLGEFPWAALVGSRIVLKHYDNRLKKIVDKSYIRYHCGGTLINTWFVLTAAHCQTSETEISEVALGEWNVLTNPDCASDDQNCDNPRVQKQAVADVIVHGSYDRSKNTNDIAIVKMKTEAKLNRFVQFACLPLAEYNLPRYFQNPESKNATVIGWGKSSNINQPINRQLIKMQNGVRTPILQKGQLTIQPLSMCQEAYPRYPITSSHLCAHDDQGHTDSCNGDSGGGLFVNSGDYAGQSEGNVHVLVGVVSYGAPWLCGDSPSVYTKVDQFIPWIRKTIG